MTLSHDELLGVQSPQILHLPPDVVSLAAAAETIELAERVDLFLDESQQITLRAALGERVDRTWAATEVVDIQARQNGKGETMIARQLAGLFLLDEELQIATAHEFPTANESFLRLVSYLENNDELRKKVARIRYANGEQGVELLNGNRLKYKARTGGGGRGFAKASTLYLDEALFLTDAHMAALKPAQAVRSSRPGPGRQTWVASSAGLATSHVLWRYRKRALAGNGGRFAYAEHTAEDIRLVDGRVISSRPDVFDRSAWAMANPALGSRIEVEFLEDQASSLSAEDFAREHLTVWDAQEGAVDALWPADVFSAVCDSSATPAGPYTLGVDATPDRSQAAVAVYGAGVVRVLPPPTIAELPAKVIEAARQLKASVAIDHSGPASFILPALDAAGIVTVNVSGAEMGRACGSLDVAVREKAIRFVTDAGLSTAVAMARTKPQGAVWQWDARSSASSIAPLVAVTLAAWVGSQPAADPLIFAY
jgi:hypothetical protein